MSLSYPSWPPLLPEYLSQQIIAKFKTNTPKPITFNPLQIEDQEESKKASSVFKILEQIMICTAAVMLALQWS